MSVHAENPKCSRETQPGFLFFFGGHMLTILLELVVSMLTKCWTISMLLVPIIANLNSWEAVVKTLYWLVFGCIFFFICRFWKVGCHKRKAPSLSPFLSVPCCCSFFCLFFSFSNESSSPHSHCRTLGHKPISIVQGHLLSSFPPVLSVILCEHLSFCFTPWHIHSPLLFSFYICLDFHLHLLHLSL